jgi:hypothetical protein
MQYLLWASAARRRAPRSSPGRWLAGSRIRSMISQISSRKRFFSAALVPMRRYCGMRLCHSSGSTTRCCTKVSIMAGRRIERRASHSGNAGRMICSRNASRADMASLGVSGPFPEKGSAPVAFGAALGTSSWSLGLSCSWASVPTSTRSSCVAAATVALSSSVSPSSPSVADAVASRSRSGR